MSHGIMNVTDDTFQLNVLSKKGISLVIFAEPGCMIYQKMSAIFNQLAEEYSFKINFYFMDSHQNKMVPQIFEIDNVPVLVLFKNGQVIDERRGEISREILVQFIEMNY